MSTSNEILVAVDGSEQSEKAVTYSCDLAKKLSAKILLVYISPVQDIPKDYIEYARAEKIDIVSYYESIGEAVLSKLADKIEKAGVSYEKLHEIGSPAARILNIADSRKAGMIVVGLRGLHGVERIRSLGSVSRRVIENSSVPVIVVPSD